jgi:DNA-binding MarR family transcriptional regulator
MTGRLLIELKQTKPFRSRTDEAYLNIIRTADLLRRATSEFLRPHDLTPAQYNVLRILRGSRGTPLSCGEVGSRLVTFEPDVTRLVDRLAARNLVERQRGTSDRRVVTLAITDAGLALLQQLDQSITDLHTPYLARLGDGRLDQLITLLEEVRADLPQPPTT